MTDVPASDRDVKPSDNLPPEVMPILPLEISDEEIAAKLYAKEQEDQANGGVNPADPIITPYDVEAHAVLRTRVMAFADAAGAWKDIKKVSSKAQSERLTDFIAGARGLLAKVEAQRKTDKAVWDDKAKAVQTAYAPLTTVLEKISDLIKPMQAQWLRDEQEKLDRQKELDRQAALQKQRDADALAAQAALNNDVVGMVEAEKLQKEADKDTRQAEKDVKAKAGSASGGGRAMSVRKIAYAIIDNQNSVYMAFRENARVVEVLQSLADAEYRAGREVKGCRRGERDSI